MPRELDLPNRIILFGGFLTTVIILPNWSYDPVSAPKLFLVSTVAGASFGFYLFQSVSDGKSQFLKDKYMLLICLFVVLVSVNIIINHYAFSERFYGIRGRATGLLAFVSMATISFVISRGKTTNRFFFFLLISNAVVCGYFLMQIMNLDIFTVQNFYSAPSSTLGNPNFVSGFLGFSVFAILHYFDFKRKVTWLITFVFLLVNLFVIFRSQSIQGIIGFLVGLFVLANLMVAKSHKVYFKIGVYSFSIIATAITLLGFSGLGPVARFLESSTVFSRLDYWRSAIRMSLDHWLFGVGLDGFGDFYRMYRDQAAIDRFGAGQTADSAHNVFLDLFASGGVPLGVTFLLISIYPAAILLLNIFKSSEFDRIGILLFTIWAAFQLQALVSVNQIGVSVWGWILLGLIVAHCRNEESKNPQIKKNNSKLPLIRSLTGIFVLIAAPLTATPQLVSEMRFLSFANKSDGISLDILVRSWPQDSRRINLIARAWSDSNYPTRARKLILEGVSFNPNYYANWMILGELPNSTPQERRRALLELKRLDPLVVPES